MLFNSLNFLLFFPLVFVIYWFVISENFKLQNILLLISSYFFYACWDWRFLFLLIFSTLLDYFTGIKIFEAGNRKRKLAWLWLSISINLGFLGVFKYYNFFTQSFADGILMLGLKVNPGSLEVILPVGISFYTFHGLSYVFDLYRGRIQPERNFINYSVFVSFFPLLVAGPIERATHLLPQIVKPRQFDYSRAINGMQQILWGFFKKVVIADNSAEFANKIFNLSDHYSGSTMVVGVFFFAIQIYCDFSGYSDIALGTARLLGIELLQNFAFPYFSRDIAEFWRRWHISLSSWFRDYLYIPLGGSQGGMWMKIRNTFIIFLVSGFWHGANWTFLAWGALNALFFMPLLISQNNRTNMEIVAKDRLFPSIKEFAQILITFSLTLFAWIFFRAGSITEAFTIVGKIFSASFFTIPQFGGMKRAAVVMILIFFFLLIEWLGREGQFALETISRRWKRPSRYALYYTLLILIFVFCGKDEQFIYFQF